MLSSSDTITNESSAKSTASLLPSSIAFPSASKKGLVGLESKGTCYINSAIQCLSNTPELLTLFLSEEYKKYINKKNPLGSGGAVVEGLSALLTELWFGNTSSVAPSGFKKIIAEQAPHLMGGGGGDSQEFLSFLLDYLHEDLNEVIQKPFVEAKDYDGRPDEIIAEESWNNYRLRNQSTIQELTHGQFRTKYECSECKKVIITFDPNVIVSLPIPKLEDIANKSISDPKLDIYKCLDLLTKEEKIDLEYGWYCSQCKTQRETIRKTDLYKVPQVLILHFKRAQFISWNQAKKNTDIVDFPINGLDLSKYVLGHDKNTIYDLFAVSNHHGKTIQGSYTTFAKNPVNRSWYHFADTNVTEISEEDIVGPDAYVLFYRKREQN